VANWLRIMIRTKYLSFFTVSYSQVSIIFPYVVVAPAYFASTIQLGGLMQTASAFSSVQDALSFFVSVYRQFAEWRAVIERLAGFEASIKSAQTVVSGAQAISVVPGSQNIQLDHLDVTLPSGKPVVAADGITIAPRDRVLVSGPSGSGKSTLFRAIAGIWPFGSGKVSMPANGSVMTLPQRPYLPIGSLAAAISYPAESQSYDAAQLRELLNAVGLSALADRLDEEAHWSRMLSLGEQQRIGIARAILHAPDFLLLDEATASLDEPSEAALYDLLGSKLPQTTIVSIGHRSTLEAFHQRHVAVVSDGDRSTLQDVVSAKA
jgi:putative ATP-binding cassette transporter